MSFLPIKGFPSGGRAGTPLLGVRCWASGWQREAGRTQADFWEKGVLLKSVEHGSVGEKLKTSCRMKMDREQDPAGQERLY